MGRTTYFHDIWLENELYKSWLKKVDTTTASCSICHRNFDVSNGGESVIKRHAGLSHCQRQWKRHKLNTAVPSAGRLDGHLKKKTSKVDVDVDVKKPGPSNATNGPANVFCQESISAMVEKSSVTEAKIRWCLKVVES